MSIFVKSLKTFESNITGENRDYKINNAVWVNMKANFELSQTDWAMGFQQEEALFGAKFVVCVLKANGLETTETEVIENTNPVDVLKFVMSYQSKMLGHTEADSEETSEGK